MNDKLINKNNGYDSVFDIKVKRKNRFFKTQRLLFINKSEKLIGFYDINDNIYDFGNKCFKINFQKVRLIKGFHFNFSIRFLDKSFYADMEGYLSKFNRKNFIKAFFKIDGKVKNITTERFNYLPDDGVESRKNLQFFLNDDFFFKVYKTKKKDYKIIFDENVNKYQIILISMLTSCLFIKF